MPHEKTYGGYTLAELRAQAKDNMTDAVVGPLLDHMDALLRERQAADNALVARATAEDEASALRAANNRLRDAECGKCGRSLAPDGDCHGCRADRLEVEIAALKKRISDTHACPACPEKTENPALKKQIAELEYQHEADTATVGILADVVDVLWEDDTRCEKHGYGDVVAKAKEVVERAKVKNIPTSPAWDGVEMISDERIRQIHGEGWSREHDTGHTHGEIAIAAAELAVDETDASVVTPHCADAFGLVAKHGYAGTKPNCIRALTIAGALIAAEIDRRISGEKP